MNRPHNAGRFCLTSAPNLGILFLTYALFTRKTTDRDIAALMQHLEPVDSIGNNDVHAVITV
jgi:hypothetical protein